MNKRMRFGTATLLAVTVLNAGYGQAQSPTAGETQKQLGASTITGNGTPGRLARWVGTTTLGDTVISENKFGLVGIGTDKPTSRLTVLGGIESLFGGFKFPDGTVQTTAGLTAGQAVTSLNGLRGEVTLTGGQNITLAVLGNAVTIDAAGLLASVATDATLTGNGTAASPLGLANNAVTAPKINAVAAPVAGQVLGFDGGNLVWQTPAEVGGVVTDATLLGDGSSASPLGIAAPLSLTGAVPGASEAVLKVENSADSGTAARLNGGFSDADPGGTGLSAQGGSSNTNVGGGGVFAFGGASADDKGGAGITAVGGQSNSFTGGEGVVALGGANASGFGGIGIIAQAGAGPTPELTGLAGSFFGGVRIGGNLEVTGSTNFKIDHPLDPANKTLVHAAIESSEVLNVYSGNVVTDASGTAVVALPDWFEAVNTDLRYQLTVVGTFAQAIVGEKVANNRFTIRTDVPNVEVSWEVTGVRSDAAMKKRAFTAVEDKPEAERGYYLTPEAFDQPEERGVNWARHPHLMKQAKEAREQSAPAQGGTDR